MSLVIVLLILDNIVYDVENFNLNLDILRNFGFFFKIIKVGFRYFLVSLIV